MADLLVIGLCTGGLRPDLLRRALDSMVCLRIPDNVRCMLQIIDSSGGHARAVYLAHKDRLPFDSTYHVSLPGRVSARNALLARTEAFSPKYLACCDDDAALHPSWLCILYEALCAADADVVTDRIQVEFTQSVSAELLRYYVQLLYLGRARRSDQVWRVSFARSGNVLCLWTAIKDFRFSPSFEQIGEDTDFFYRCSRQGVRIYEGAWGLITEQWDAERASMRWLLQRHHAIGVASSRIYCHVGWGGFGRALYECAAKLGLALVRLAQAMSAYAVFWTLKQTPAWVRAWQALFLFSRSLGYLSGLLYSLFPRNRSTSRSTVQ